MGNKQSASMTEQYDAEKNAASEENQRLTKLVWKLNNEIDSLKKQCEDCQKENAEFRRRRNVSQEIRAEDSTIVQRVVALIEECSPKKEDSTEIAVESGGDAARCVVKGIQDIMSTSIRYKSCGNLLSSLLKDLEKTDTSTPPTPATIFSPESLKSANASNDVLVRFRVFAFATSLVWAREYVRSRRFARTVQRQTEELQRLRELSFTLQSEAKQTDSSSSGGMVYDNMEMGHMNSSEFKTTSSGDSNQETSESTSLVSTKSLPEEDSEGPLSEERDEPNARSLPDDDQAAAIERKRLVHSSPYESHNDDCPSWSDEEIRPEPRTNGVAEVSKSISQKDLEIVRTLRQSLMDLHTVLRLAEEERHQEEQRVETEQNLRHRQRTHTASMLDIPIRRRDSDVGQRKHRRNRSRSFNDKAALL